MKQNISGNAANDDPLSGGDIKGDYLGRREFAKSAVGVLQSLRRTEASSVVALVGPWGGGKTSVLNMIKSLLVETTPDNENSWLISDFNPWFFQDMTSLQMAYFRELGSALPKQRNGEKARSKLASFGHAIAPFGSIVAMLGGPDVSKPLQALSDLISPDESVAKIHATLENALRELDHPILMVLDDLDRLAPDELLLTLKLIRLIGRLPNVHYIVAYDEDTLLDALSRTGLVGNDPRRGIEYLEKIIQVRLDVPPVRQRQLNKWLERSLSILRERYELDFSGDAQNRLAYAFYGPIRAKLTTPRALKRYFNQVEAFLGNMHEEIDAVDFLVLTWFRTAEPLVYDMIAQERSALLGETKSFETANLFGKPDKEKLRGYWELRLQTARVSSTDIEDVADLLGRLFPRFRAHWNRDEFSNNSSRSIPARRIQNPDYFDRYFAFGVPSEDVSDAEAENLYRQIIANEVGPERNLVEEKITQDIDNLAIVLNKIIGFFETSLTGGVELLKWIAQQRTKHPDDDDGFFTPEMQSRWAAQQIFLLLPEDEAIAAADALSGDTASVLLASYLVRAAANDHSIQGSTERAAIYDEAAQHFSSAIHALLENLDESSPFEVSSAVWGLLWDWQIIDQESAVSWLKSRIDADIWPLIDVVARFVSSRKTMGVSNAPWTLGNLDMGIIDRLLGIDYVLEALNEEISAVIPVNPDYNRLENTPENRRAVALSQLRSQREAQAPSDDAPNTGKE